MKSGEHRHCAAGLVRTSAVEGGMVQLGGGDRAVGQDHVQLLVAKQGKAPLSRVDACRCEHVMGEVACAVVCAVFSSRVGGEQARTLSLSRRSFTADFFSGVVRAGNGARNITFGGGYGARINLEAGAESSAARRPS